MVAIVVTTIHKGVFFGYVEDADIPESRTMKLKQARICIYWPASNKGVLGLASAGPQTGAKISAAVPQIELTDITSVIYCSAEAIEEWEKGKWG